jgi:hypothetical protein
MSISALSFSATLPTSTAVGINKTVFSSNRLEAKGDVLINTQDPSTGLPSLLDANFSANGLNYTSLSHTFSPDTLSIVFGLPSDASKKQKAQAADQAMALSDVYAGNGDNFIRTGTSVSGSNLDATSYTSYNVVAQSILNQIPSGQKVPDQGSGVATVQSSGASGLEISSISTDGSGTIDVVYSLTNAAPVLVPASSTSGQAQAPRTAAKPAYSASSGLGLVNVLAQNENNTSSLNPNAQLANSLAQAYSPSLSLYNIPSGLNVSPSSGSYNILV